MVKLQCPYFPSECDVVMTVEESPRYAKEFGEALQIMQIHVEVIHNGEKSGDSEGDLNVGGEEHQSPSVETQEAGMERGGTESQASDT